MADAGRDFVWLHYPHQLEEELEADDPRGAGARLADADADTWPDFLDNCPETTNPEQFDDDRDLFGNATTRILDKRVSADAGGRRPRARLPRRRHDARAGAGRGSRPTRQEVARGAEHAICRIADLDEDDVDVTRARIGTRMDARCVPGAVAPFERPGCVRSRLFATVDLRIRNVNRAAEKQFLLLTARAFAEVVIDDFAAATEHCGETSFASEGGGPTCAMSRTGSEVVCR